MIQNYFVYSLNKKWRQLSSIGAIWLSDGDRTNYNIIFGGFEEIGFIYVVPVFHWLCKFGLDVLWEIDVKKYKTQLVYGIKIKCNSRAIIDDLKRLL